MTRFLSAFLVFAVFLFSSCKETNEIPKTQTAKKAPVEKVEKKTEKVQQTEEETGKVTMNTDNNNNLTPPTLDDVGSPDDRMVIETEKGNIVVEFFPDVAPMHVANFKKLAKANFFDGTTFHRVLPGFVIQGGDPNTKNDDPNDDGQGGPPYRIKAEFNSILHEKGILSMARSQDVNSAGSQFFICLGRTTHLDNKYTVFGKVIKGIEVVDNIASLRRDPSKTSDRKLPAVKMNRVYIINKSEVDNIK